MVARSNAERELNQHTFNAYGVKQSGTPEIENCQMQLSSRESLTQVALNLRRLSLTMHPR